MRFSAASDTMQTTEIHPDAVSAHYRVLNKIGLINSQSEHGFFRLPYSDAETQATNYIRQSAEASGLHCRYDAVGNLIVELPGLTAQWVETGSHIDTVPGGGNFDGTAGVVAGLTALQEIQNSGTTLQQGLRLRIWRGEESASYGVTSIGSRAAFGQLPKEALDRCYQGISLADAMRAQGADPEVIHRAEATISSEERDGITAFIELHIEQGKLLEQLHKDIGIVTAIRGSRRNWIHLRGTFDHSGATPMGNQFRHDANLAMAYMQVELDQLLQQANGEGAELVQTVGLINPPDSPLTLNENAITKVSGAASFSFEVRGCRAEALNSYSEKAFMLIHDIGRRFGVTVEIDTFSDQAGIEALDPSIQALLGRASKQLNLTTTKLASGAWHDAGTVARQLKSDGSTIPVGMIFIPCKGGISHSADEFSSAEQIAKGASLLATAMLELASNYKA